VKPNQKATNESTQSMIKNKNITAYKQTLREQKQYKPKEIGATKPSHQPPSQNKRNRRKKNTQICRAKQKQRE
jgi:hypothetical protein